MSAKLKFCVVLCVAFFSQVTLATEDALNVFQTHNAVKATSSDACNAYIAQIKKGIRNMIMLAVEAVGLPVACGAVSGLCMITTFKVAECSGHFFVSLWHLARYLIKYAAVIIGTMGYAVYGAATHCYVDSLAGSGLALLS